MSDCKHNPPRWAKRLLHQFGDPDELPEVEGDLYELYQRWVEEHGLKKAQWLYGINAITFLRPSAVKKRKTKSDYSTNHTIMFSNYFKIAYRNLLKSRVFSFINLAGFLLGFVPAIFIALYVIDELSFDAFHTNADRIYRITETIRDETGERQGVGAAAQVAPSAVERLPEVERAVRVAAFGRLTLGYGEFRDFEENWFVDANFFELFDFQFIAGNPETALDAPYSIVLTQTLATKYFGDELPLGKSMYGSFENEVTVTGIIEDFPSNSHLNPSLLFSTSTLFSEADDLRAWAEDDWTSTAFDTYLLLSPDANPENLSQQLTTLANEHRPEDERENQYHLQALTDIHFRSQHLEKDTNAHKSDIAYVYVFIAIGLLVLGIAFINYVNLSTARAMKRAKEVGLRKTVGASRRQLVYQFMSESLLTVMLTLVVAVMFVQLLLPTFNELTGKSLHFNLLEGPTLLVLLGVGLASGILAGAYPAFYLSRSKPTVTLKQASSARENTTLRQLLVVGQFAFAIFMITATAIIYQQLNFIRNTNLGYDREQLVTVDINSQPMREKYESVKTAFQQIAAVESVTATNRVPGEWKGIPTASVQHENTLVEFLYLAGDEDFLPTYDIQLREGRNFQDSRSDSAKVLLNETAVQAMGLTNPIGQFIEVTHFDEEVLDQPFRAEVIGVIQDVHFESVHEKVAPTLITYYRNPFHAIDYYTLRISPKNVTSTLAAIEAVTQQTDPENPLEYHFLDDKFEELYATDTQSGKIFGIAASLAILIACMGLFGLTNLSVEQRTKEVGIRKVLGAEVGQLAWLISRNFLKLVGIAFLLAAPIVWWSMDYWLREFAYRIDVSWWVLGLAGLFTLLIALLTVVFQTVKAALANPVDSLRYE